MLEIISKKDKEWRDYAFKICKCKTLADDIVQEMYLRLHRKPKEYLTDYYVILLIRSVYSNYLKTKRQNISLESFHYIDSKERIFEPDDLEQTILNRYNKLDWKQRELLSEIYDRSLREIEEMYPLIHYAYAFREIKKAREQILDK